MQIDQLRLRISDADLRQLLPVLRPRETPVDELSVTITPAGFVAKGKYKQTITVGFEAMIKVIANGAVVGIQLADLKAAGPLGGMLRGVITKMITERLRGYPGVQEASGGVIVDINGVIESLGFASRVKDVKITPGDGEVTVEIAGQLSMADADRIKALI